MGSQWLYGYLYKPNVAKHVQLHIDMYIYAAFISWIYNGIRDVIDGYSWPYADSNSRYYAVDMYSGISTSKLSVSYCIKSQPNTPPTCTFIIGH